MVENNNSHEYDFHFRALLIRLQDNLSDNDRRRLHFLLGDIIRRDLRDDPTIAGTLNLLESLFDRGTINDRDFFFLIEAFRQIERHDIAQRLIDHARHSGKSYSLSDKLLEETQEDNIQTGLQVQSRQVNILDMETPKKTKDVPSLFNVERKILFLRALIIAALLVFIVVLSVVFARYLKEPSPVVEKPPSISFNTSTPTITHREQRNNTNRVILGYYGSWSIYRDPPYRYSVDDIKAEKLTHISYAFAKINTDWQLTVLDNYADTAWYYPGDTSVQSLRGHLNQLIKLKEKHPKLKTLIAIGGYEHSGLFSDTVLTDERRRIFASSCVTFMQKYGFDGVDVMWLYPVSGGKETNVKRPEDKENYVLLLAELDRQFRQFKGKNFLLTVSVGVGQTINNLNLTEMVRYVDWMTVMTYEFHGSWDPTTGHHAGLYGHVSTNDGQWQNTLNCNTSIQQYLNAGVPSEKLVMTIPLFGRGWLGVTSTVQNGYGQAASNRAPNGTSQPGNFFYDDIKQNFLPFYNRYFDNQSKVPFIYNSSTGIWISYDDLESNSWKNQYVLEHRLRGVAFWKLAYDRNAELVSDSFDKLTKIELHLPHENKKTLQSLRKQSHTIPAWKENVHYREHDYVKYNEKIYQCTKDHISMTNMPPISEDILWKDVLNVDVD